MLTAKHVLMLFDDVDVERLGVCTSALISMLCPGFRRMVARRRELPARLSTTPSVCGRSIRVQTNRQNC
jgi:hypothetical protein